MLNIPPELRIANAAAVLDGPHGAVTRRAHQQALSRQALYRDTQRLLHVLRHQDTTLPPEEVRSQIDALRRQLAELQAQLDSAVFIDDDRLAAFASTAQAEGVSLPVARRLLAPLLAKPLNPAAPAKRRLPSVARLGRLSRAAAQQATALLPVLDALSRDRAEQVAADEIFFGKKPCLMVIEQRSLA